MGAVEQRTAQGEGEVTVASARHRWLIRIGVAVLLVVLACCWTFHIWGLNDWRAFLGMNEECHPAWWKVHWGKVYPGQDMEKAIRLTGPVHVFRTGRYTEALFHRPQSYTNLVITARDGKVIGAYAHSCTWGRVFFDGMTREDHAEKAQEWQNFLAWRLAEQ